MRTRGRRLPRVMRSARLASNSFSNMATTGAMSIMRNSMPSVFAQVRASSASAPPSPSGRPRARTLLGPIASAHSFATTAESTPPLRPSATPRRPLAATWWRMKDVTMSTCSSRNRGSRAGISAGEAGSGHNLSALRVRSGLVGPQAFRQVHDETSEEDSGADRHDPEDGGCRADGSDVADLERRGHVWRSLADDILRLADAEHRVRGHQVIQ